MIQFNRQPGQKVLELGCGNNPNPSADVHVDVRPIPNVTDFTVDFEKEHWDEIGDNGFDGVLAVYCYEHISWRKSRNYLANVFRILKPGGKAVLVTPNTEAQIRFILDHPDGWRGDDAHVSFSKILFGDADYPENTHKAYLSPSIMSELCQAAGFEKIIISPHGDGEINCDMVTEMVKPANLLGNAHRQGEAVGVDTRKADVISTTRTNVMTTFPATVPLTPTIPLPPVSERFNRLYFEGRAKYGSPFGPGIFLQDFPHHAVIAKKILSKQPQSFLELGCARGFITKRIQDTGIPAYGIDVSKHCWLTRACDGLTLGDITQTPWKRNNENFIGAYDVANGFDFCFSCALLEHIPEEQLAAVFKEIALVSQRGLHAITPPEHDNGQDQTRVTIRPVTWWREQFDAHGLHTHEITSVAELRAGEVPPEVLKGDGYVKWNLGSFLTQHHGWINCDQHDLKQWSESQGYQFQQLDITKGIPVATGTVDAFLMNHVFEHFDYNTGLAILRDLRRAIKPTGVLRIAVPDAFLLMGKYFLNQTDNLAEYDEVNDGCANASTSAEKLYALLQEGHRAQYDMETLCRVLKEAKFVPLPTSFRKTQCGDMGQVILKTGVDMHPSLSLYCEANPLLG
ncbi:MAG: methyltransferase domain-containing protein [Patescibacteria group bacterium]|nr:methyltransferase domain-containing protein [Patescibacteria group bacterium]